MYWSVVWCSGGCCWKCHKTLTFCSLLTRCTIPCACHAKRHLYLQKWSEPLVFLTFDFDMCFAPQPRALFPHRNFQKWRAHVVLCTFSLRHVLRATTACTFSTSELPKVVRTWCVLYIFTSKCASRHNGVHFSHIGTFKSGANMWCFVHFHFKMCFAPQRRALFWHLNFQKWSGNGVFCTFSLANVLRATTACTFSTSQLPKVLRHPGVLKISLANVLRATTACNFSSLIWPAGSAPAALASLLFDPPEPQIIGKNTVFRDFPTFSRICIFFLLTVSLLLFFLLIFLFSLPLPCSAFHLSILSEVWLLNFLRQLYIYIYIWCSRNNFESVLQFQIVSPLALPAGGMSFATQNGATQNTPERNRAQRVLLQHSLSHVLWCSNQYF